MSSKSAAHPPIEIHTLFTRKFIMIAGIVMISVFLLTVVVYPFIFNPDTNKESQNSNQPVVVPPVVLGQ